MTRHPILRGAAPVLAAASLLFGFPVGCGGGAASGPTTRSGDRASVASPWVGQRAQGIEDPALAEVVRAHWEALMADAPTFATRLGDHRYDDRIFDRSEDGWAARRARTRAFRDRLQAISGDGLSAADRVNRDLLLGQLEAHVAGTVCRFEEWNVSARSNAVSRWNTLPQIHPFETAGDGDHYLARLAQSGDDVRHEIAGLRRGLESGRVASAESLRRTVALVRGQLAETDDGWTTLDPLESPREAWSAEERGRFDEAARTLVADTLRPALTEYAEVLENELLPRGREESEAGLGGLPDGGACYQAMVRRYLGLERTPEQLHELGRRELARTDAAIAALGASLFGSADLAATLAHVREDPALFYEDREAVEAKAEEALAAAREAMPRAFGRLPQAPCVVSRVPDYEAPFTTIAYYRPPAPDGSRPGEYFINSWQPETRPRYGMEALTFHESIPGHHLQIAISQELPSLPLFRKHLGTTAFVEGWALYSERLAEELGLYTGDLDLLGMHGYQAWRAARLVVDTGLHAMGWTREQAVELMMAHTALAEENVRNEVDRYLGTPGQALAYKVGQLEIERLRREAEATLGEGFDLRGFHDVVLGGGAVSLPVLEDRVAAWVETERAP